MSPYLSESVLGTEELLDAIESAIIRDINAALAEIYARRTPADEARAALRGEEYIPLEYEQVPPSHVWVGNFPSMVLEEVGKEAYPYIAVTPEDYTPEAEDPFQDQRDVYRSGFTVHSLAKADPEGDTNGVGIDHASDVVFRRAVRMSEAVFLVLKSDPTVGRMLSGTSNPARGQHSLPWTYQYEGVGPNFWFQAVGVTYTIKSYTPALGPTEARVQHWE
jgi:hypothetical protein